MQEQFIAFQSTYSLLQSTISIDRMIAYAKEQALQHLLIADKHVLFGAIEFYQKAQAAGLVPHIGMQLAVGEIAALCIAQNNTGLQSLQHLSSEINSFGYAFTSYDALFAALTDVIVIFEIADEAALAALQGKHNCEVFLQQSAGSDVGVGLPRVHLPVVNCLTNDDISVLETLHAIDQNVEKVEIASFPKAIVLEKGNHEVPAAFLAATLTYDFHTYRLPAYSNDAAANVQLFDKLCEAGLKKRYGATLSQEHVQRLKYEMGIIKAMGFVDYFLIIWDVMLFARKADIIIGPGRGSAVGSIVAYVLGITKIDPIKYNLLFERFLNSGRKTMPDIDIDVEDRRRMEIIEYLRQKYGYHHVAHILTFGTFGAKSAIRDVGKAYSHKATEINTVLKQITNSYKSIDENIAENPKLQKILQTHTAIAEIVAVAKIIEGFPRHSSTHAAGIILTDEPIETFIATIEPEAQMLVTQATMVYCENIGLLKIDFLGLRNLTIIRQVAEQVMQGDSVVAFIEQEIPDDDPVTFKMLSTGETTGIFQLESPGMRQVLQKFKIQEFMDIAIVLSLYRPGPMQFIDEYIARKDKRKQYTIQLADVQPILGETHGIMVYQEQVMQIAQTIGGMSLAEADDFRRAMSKKNHELLQEQRLKFLAGGQAKGLDEQDLATLFDEVMAFASYGFNKSHAIAYAAIAYQMAYLKVHYPAVFMSGLLNSVIQSENKALQYLQEASRFGIKILPADINKSAGLYMVENKNIRIGLSAIKSVGKITVQHILTLRAEAPFRDLADFLMRTESKIVNVGILEQLTNAYAFSSFSKNQKAIHTYFETHEAGRKFQGSAIQVEALIQEDITDYTLEERRELEQKAYGFSLFAHPLLHYPKNTHSLSHPPQSYLSYVVYVERVHEITTKKGDKMAFATLSDMREATEVVIFPYAYEKYSLFLREHNVVKVTVQLPKPAEGQKGKLSVSKVEPMAATN